jgi:hypothetical protein
MDTEITYEEALALVKKRIAEIPTIEHLIADPEYHISLSRILTYEEISEELLPLIEHEILVVLACYASPDSLATNIAESTGLSVEKSASLVTMLEMQIFPPIQDELDMFQYFWEHGGAPAVPQASKDLKEELELRPEFSKSDTIASSVVAEKPAVPEAPKDLKEELELRPEGVPAGAPTPEVAQPLTRDAVLRALSPSRTMAQDIASLQHGEGSGQ